MKTAASLLPGAKERLSIIDRLLKEIHETPKSTLGNKSAALDEAIYIILSFQTDLPRAAAMWSDSAQPMRRGTNLNELQ